MGDANTNVRWASTAVRCAPCLAPPAPAPRRSSVGCASGCPRSRSPRSRVCSREPAPAISSSAHRLSTALDRMSASSILRCVPIRRQHDRRLVTPTDNGGDSPNETNASVGVAQAVANDLELEEIRRHPARQAPTRGSMPRDYRDSQSPWIVPVTMRRASVPSA